MSIAILAKDIGKEYRIGGPQKTYDRLGEQVVDMMSAPFRRAASILRGDAAGAAELKKRFWALQDISFQIDHGEVVGIIGRNGAGKSTLLKILSRITDPTVGEARIYGRVGSLLEVGTGFHPELTGRENIFLNGAILGMRKTEITRKFDEIVAFAEIDDFIDTPVKHYSSGMYVRLAFAVAAHLEPEILLVDEVLAVGDVAFQRKSLGKMSEVAAEGRTVLFVSHNMGLVQTLCQRGIVLQGGRIVFDGGASDSVECYLRSLETMGQEDLTVRTDRQGAGEVRAIDLTIFNGENQATSMLITGSPARFEVTLDGWMYGMTCVLTIFDHLGRPVTKFQSDVQGPDDEINPELGHKFVCEIDEFLLMSGSYRVDIWLRGGDEVQDYVQAAVKFDVETGLLRGRPVRATPVNPVSMLMPHRWQTPK